MIETEFQESPDPCAYLALPQKYFKFPSGFAVGKGSQFEDILNRAWVKLLSRIMETSLMSLRWWWAIRNMILRTCGYLCSLYDLSTCTNELLCTVSD